MAYTGPKASINHNSYRFNHNASLILIASGDHALVRLFESLGYECGVQESGRKYQIPCPLCSEANVLLMTGGDTYPLYWKCLSGICPSRHGNHVKNLLGLVRACTEDKNMGTAFKTIARHLGCTNPFAITNMTDPQVAEVINGEMPDADYVFLVADLDLKRRLDRSGLATAYFGGNCKAPYLKRRHVVVLLTENGDAVAERLRTKTNVVVAHDPTILKNLHGYDLKQRAASMLRMAARSLAAASTPVQATVTNPVPQALPEASQAFLQVPGN